MLRMRKVRLKRKSNVPISKPEKGTLDVPLTWRMGAKLIEWRTGVNPLNFLSKWKTFIGGVGLVATGVAKLLDGDWEVGSTMISMGFVALGFGGKLERAAEVAESNGTAAKK